MSVPADPAVLAGLDAYRDRPAGQQPTWPDAAVLAEVTAELSAVPPLVFAGEADALREKLALAQRGEAFLLQGGDCAETFAEATAERIRNKIKTILQMSIVLTYGASMPVVKMGRIAGQYAKPRSSDTETRDGVTLPAFRGDIVNVHDFTPEARIPDPRRLLKAYQTSAATLNLSRAFTMGGFADMRRVHEWNLGFTVTPAYRTYEGMASEIDRAIRFMAAAGADFDALRTVDFYAGHEGLLLDYERPLTRIDSRTGLPYDVSGHFLWIGERTRQLDGAHVDFLSRVRNPIGVKIGPKATPAEVLELIDRLDPQREPGRLTLITRMGAGLVADNLPPLLQAVKDAGEAPLWVCDPMHGNTVTSGSGYKTRHFDDVLSEVRGFFDAHRQVGTIPAGLHMELTGEDVTECIGGFEDISDSDLASHYGSVCDPRLNHQQSLELSFLVADYLRQ